MVKKPVQAVKKMAAKRPHISQALKYEVWLKSMGNCIEGKCPISWCTQRVTFVNCVLAHNIPFCKGGATTLENLSIACYSCNSSMGARYTVDEWNKLGSAGAPARYGTDAAAVVHTDPCEPQPSMTACGCWGK